MSTNGVIARKTGLGKFDGRYHHWDSYPTGLGRSLSESLHTHFQGDLAEMLHVLLDKHCAWSTIVNKDFSLKPGYVNYDKLPSRFIGTTPELNPEYDKHPNVRRPQCYCHGARHEKVPACTEKDVSEWAYVFDESTYTLDVLYGESEKWHRAGTVDLRLTAENINWTVIECGEGFCRCNHYAWAHFPELRNTTSGELDTQTYLGIKPLRTDEWNHVKHVIIGSKRYRVGGGCSAPSRWDRSGYTGKPAWIGSLTEIDTGKSANKPVALVTSTGYKPFPGVTWVFPPTKVNPTETLRKGA